MCVDTGNYYKEMITGRMRCRFYLTTRKLNQRTTSSENVTLRFCNHFSIIPSRLTFLLVKCVLTILEANWVVSRLEEKIEALSSSSHFVHNCKTGHFTSLIGRESELRNVQKWKTLVQSVQNYCFSLLNMQNCDVLLGVVAYKRCKLSMK